MALATELDPLQATKDLLTGTADGDWDLTGSKPDDIELTEETERRIKEQRSGDAIYLQATLETDHVKLAAGGNDADEVAVVTAELWTTTSAARAEALKRDLIDIVADKANDSNTTTAWVDWRIQATEDFTGQTSARGADHYVKSVQIKLRDLRSI